MKTLNLKSASIITVAAILTILVLPTSSEARRARDPIHNKPRCDAHFILASCSLDECSTRNPEKVERCNAVFRRELKRPNRNFDCGFNTCDAVELHRKLEKVERDLAHCEVDSQIDGLGEQGVEECLAQCEATLEGVWNLAEDNFCDDIAMPVSCDEFD